MNEPFETIESSFEIGDLIVVKQSDLDRTIICENDDAAPDLFETHRVISLYASPEADHGKYACFQIGEVCTIVDINETCVFIIHTISSKKGWVWNADSTFRKV